MINNKRAQEEMVGFVMIILLVAVIFLVFLGIYLRQGPARESVQNTEVGQFLDALSEITTDCTINGVKKTVKDLLQNDLGKRCEDTDITVNESLKTTITEAIESGWNFNANSTTKGYEFKSLDLEFGHITDYCSREKPSVTAQKYISEDITIELKICKFD